MMGRAVTPEFFQVFDAAPAPGVSSTLTTRLRWCCPIRHGQAQFGGDARAVGRVSTLDGKPYRIVGVVPRTSAIRRARQALCRSP